MLNLDYSSKKIKTLQNFCRHIFDFHLKIIVWAQRLHHCRWSEFNTYLGISNYLEACTIQFSNVYLNFAGGVAKAPAT